METQDIKQSTTSVDTKDNSNSSEKELLIENIELPGSNFSAKWMKDKGYAVGLENHRLTRFHESLNDALEEINYETFKDEDGDTVLKRKKGTNFEHIVNIVRILLTVQQENNQQILEETIKKINEHGKTNN